MIINWYRKSLLKGMSLLTTLYNLQQKRIELQEKQIEIQKQMINELENEITILKLKGGL